MSVFIDWYTCFSLLEHSSRPFLVVFSSLVKAWMVWLAVERLTFKSSDFDDSVDWRCVIFSACLCRTFSSWSTLVSRQFMCPSASNVRFWRVDKQFKTGLSLQYQNLESKPKCFWKHSIKTVNSRQKEATLDF